MIYRIETATTYGWDHFERDDGLPVYYSTRDEAEASLADFLTSSADMDMDLDPSDYRVTKLADTEWAVYVRRTADDEFERQDDTTYATEEEADEALVAWRGFLEGAARGRGETSPAVEYTVYRV